MRVTADLEALKVHTCRGKLWCAQGGGLPKPTHMDLPEFLDSSLLLKNPHMRLIGMPCNAKLITALYDRKTKGIIESVQVVTPMVCPTSGLRREPDAAVHYMRKIALAPSQGGFHEVLEPDYLVYAMLVLLDPRYPGNVSQTIRLMHAHPVWSRLSFIPDLDEVACAVLIASVADPRWYIDLAHPDRSAKLEAFLGLLPRTQAGVSVSGRPAGRHHRRCQNVLDCWKRPEQGASVAALLHVTGTDPVAKKDGVSRPCGLRPGDFIWRKWAISLALEQHGPRNIANARMIKADLAASRRFIRFLRYVWLDSITAGEVLPEQHTALFRPTQFFKHGLEVAGYNAHVRSGS